MLFTKETIIMFVLIIISVTTAVFVITVYFELKYSYWHKRNFPYLLPKFPLGNLNKIMLKGVSLGTPTKDFYDKLKVNGYKFGGVYTLVQPALVIVDPDYVKDILTVDFQYFVNRGIYHDEEHDPLSAHLFTQDGADWRRLRIKLTSTFTSGKMKLMFDSILKCSQNMIETLNLYAEQYKQVDIHSIVDCFTIDVIGVCAFGIDCNSFQHSQTEFLTMAQRIIKPTPIDSIYYFLTINMPTFAKWLGIVRLPKDLLQFFLNIIYESVKYREENFITRPDFLQLLINLRNQAGNDDEGNLSLNEIAAQCFIFFLAGFETSSTTIQYALFELAQNQNVQELLRKEINDVIEKNDGKITYEALAEMKFLGQCVDETLRLYPSVSTLNRECTQNYTFKNTKLTIEKGTPIFISVLGLHRDPEYWPNPLKWDPNRFAENNKVKRRSCTYIPFGDGPRNCIGLRFGLMQTKIGILSIVKNFRITLNESTKLPIEFDDTTFLLYSKNKIYLNLKKI